MDVFVLRVPANDPNLFLSAAVSQVEAGYKETASTLLRRTGAIAGVNGDFFGMAGTHSMATGLQIDTSGVRAVSNNVNTGTRLYSSFMLAADGNYFMNYVNADIRFLNNFQENMQIGSYNKIADLGGPSVITADLMPDTSQIDARLDNAVKIVVRQEVIVYISQKGETVQVPTDGYIIIMSGAYADQVIRNFAVGQRADLRVDVNLDIWNLQSAISGGGKIITNGQFVSEGQFFSTGVHPRTAIGITEDMREIILMVVDGRTHSVGVSHEQLAQLMFEAGAFNAMHLDGGGSSEMHITRAGTQGLTLVNYPSGGVERRIINALGLYVQAPPGVIHSIAIEIPSTVVRSVPTRFTVYALDEYKRRIEIPFGAAHMTVIGDGMGSVSGNYFVARNEGLYTITANFSGMTANVQVFATPLFEIRPNVQEIVSYVGGKHSLNFTGVGANGNVFNIEPYTISIDVFPANLGHVMDGVYTATSIGAGWLRCMVGETVAFIPIYNTIQTQLIDRLSGGRPMSSSATPDNVRADAFYANIPDYFMPVAALVYHFLPAEHTQAAYAIFEGFTSPGARGYKLAVFGDLSGNWLRGRVIDAEGTIHLIDFARRIDWEGWEDVTAWLPEGIAYPVRLDQIYVASLSSDRETVSQLLFSNLRALYDITDSFPTVVTPPSDRFRDGMQTVFYEFSDYGYDITFMPSVTAPPAGRGIEGRAMDMFLFNASAGIHFGRLNTDMLSQRHWTIQHNRTHLVEYNPVFNTFGLGRLYVVQLTAASTGGNNGLMFADVTQWSRLRQAIDNSHTRHVVLLMDVSPLEFANRAEFELLHSLLREYARREYNIFVLSEGGTAPDVQVIDGVRYMRFGALYNDGVLNEDFSVLRFRMWDYADVRYSVERVIE